MLSVSLIFIYICFTTLIVGTGISALFNKLIGYESNSILAKILIGVASVTWYAQVYSIFDKVGLTANILLCIFCALLIIFLKKEYEVLYKQIKNCLLKNRWYAITSIVLFLIIAYGTSHGIIHYDTGLYHAQAIRWIEQYGVIKGLGNLHTRLAYNSAAFPLTALYSFSFIAKQSFHVTAGFCALILAWECMGLSRIYNEKCLSAASFARFMAIYYLLIIYDEMISPASDYYMVCLAFVLVIRWLDKSETDDLNTPGYTMLAFLAGVILTIKLSGAFLLLVAILPVIRYLKDKKCVEIIKSLFIGVVIVLPYLIRNIYISGWLLYPSTAINLGNFEWKIPSDIAISDYKEIQVYGRGYTDVSEYERPITSWFGSWFSNQSTLEKAFILASIVAVAYFVIKCFYYGFLLCKNKKGNYFSSSLLIDGVLCVCLLFWLFTSPLMRYGCLYVYLTAGVIWGRCILEHIHKPQLLKVLYICLLLFGCYKVVMFGKEVIQAFRVDTLILQQDYENFEVFAYEIDGEEFFAPCEGDRVGYDAFPSSPWVMDDISFIGNKIEDGFRANR